LNSEPRRIWNIVLPTFLDRYATGTYGFCVRYKNERANTAHNGDYRARSAFTSALLLARSLPVDRWLLIEADGWQSDAHCVVPPTPLANRKGNSAMTELRLEDFETDFWKDISKRKTWDQIVPGEVRETVPVTLTKEVIQKFARCMGEDNPLYLDEAYAKRGPFGGLIAPPSIHILLMFACTKTDDWMRSPGTINAGQSWFYNVPARPGDTITMHGTALDRFIKKERLFVVHDNVFYNQHGEVVCSGRGWTIRPN
jgi:3-hydroxybutyryl-CoA dehydratase